MKKILMILACCMLLCGCGNGHASEEQKNLNETEDGKENEVSVDLSGYEKITESVYIKNDLEAEIPTTYFSFQDAEAALQWRTFQFFMGEITRLEFSDFLVYVDCGDGEKKYSGKEMYAVESEEELYAMFPEEWREYFGTSISKVGDIDMSDVDSIIEEKIVKPLVEKYGEKDTEVNVISESKSEIDGEEASISLVDNDGKHNLRATAYAKSEEKACALLTCFVMQFEKLGNLDGFSVIVYCGDLYALYLKTDNGPYITGKNRDGSSSLVAPDWFVSELTMPEEQQEELYVQVAEAIKKFSSLEGLETKENNREIFQDENIKIEFTGISGKENEYKVNFIIENLSGRTLIVQPRETSINGFMVDPICSMEIAPGKKIKDGMQIWNEDAETTPMSEVQHIEMKFHVFDDNDSSFRYDTENIIVMD